MPALGLAYGLSGSVQAYVESGGVIQCSSRQQTLFHRSLENVLLKLTETH